MQTYLLTALLGLCFLLPSLSAQQTLPLPLPDHRGCELPVVRQDILYYRPYTFKDRPRPKAMTFTVDYLEDGRRMFGDTCVAWPEAAKEALEYAASIWSDVLENEFSVDIAACYSPDMAAGTLGSAQPALSVLIGLMGDTVVVPKALAENLLARNLNGNDIRVIINKNFDFYYGTDAAPPPSQVDFVTLCLHELGHGLGFVGSAAVDDGDPLNGTECLGTAGTGCLGYYADFSGQGARYYPYVFDLFADRGSDDTRLLDLPNPGAEIRTELLGGGAGLFFDGANQTEYYPSTDAFELYAPGTFRPGSSFSHFRDNSEVLFYALSYGNAIHDVGKASEVMQNIGWPRALAPANALPVRWQDFSATLEEGGVSLSWTTAAETDNAGFGVEVSRNGEPFVTLGEVAAATGGDGTGGRYRYQDPRPAPGLHLYRIRQTDFDGTASYSYVVGVRVEVEETAIGNPYPNPTARSVIHLPVRSTGPATLTLRLIDATGRSLVHRLVDIGTGDLVLPVDLATVPRGVHTLLVEMHGLRSFRRVVVQ